MRQDEDTKRFLEKLRARSRVKDAAKTMWSDLSDPDVEDRHTINDLRADRALRKAVDRAFPKSNSNVIIQCLFYTVRDASINNVLALSDISTFVHSAVARDFHGVPGPSVEASFLAFHKAYTRQYMDPAASTTPYAVVDLDSPTMLTDAKQALRKVGFPAFVKPATGFASVGVKKVNSDDEMTSVLQNLRTMRDKYPNFLSAPSASFFRSFYEEYVDVKKYPLALRDAVVVEPFIDAENFYTVDGCVIEGKIVHWAVSAYMSFYEEYVDVKKYPLALRDAVVVEPFIDAENFYTVDGCVIDGQIVHWAITDSLRYDDQDARFVTMICPTTLTHEQQKPIWDFYDDVMTKMIRFGFNNSFAHIEIF
uniref:ATP-grasp domain-containing protein n=1 Tax=Branchiostoma floridae TaxID=7739 RepID=C3Z5Y8_BRAFL|eukprot:XP_002596239.1 hypothetical protein BRAFLDRAFT_66012 [Branchiostoma floridae]